MPREREYLTEMQIDCWELLHPERLSGYTQAEPVKTLVLPGGCELLLVSPELPENEEAEYLVKILASIHLSVEQVKHVYPQQLDSVDFTAKTPKWIWFAGCASMIESPSIEHSQLQQLLSPPLTDIRGNNQHRRALWQQICSYA
ncbi:DNA polymerase III subunit psi [Vibrio albus]|jgi:DNA polymerase-3 subunit psi|uniref:DNA polymerase III subunit psi n=1 Tax=Vibrio albus TaxID=2200953 RepID=A0A2U3BEP5_9VIBR|nr:DNA polymerase III subunit psi [Vibrio albus]PWI35257.1 DNA polymerase III subunit psi [Vibrio albus]